MEMGCGGGREGDADQRNVLRVLFKTSLHSSTCTPPPPPQEEQLNQCIFGECIKRCVHSLDAWLQVSCRHQIPTSKHKKSCREKINKMDKPYKRLQSQGHVKWPTVIAYCLLSCREHATLICVPFPIQVTLHLSQGHDHLT